MLTWKYLSAAFQHRRHISTDDATFENSEFLSNWVRLSYPLSRRRVGAGNLNEDLKFFFRLIVHLEVDHFAFPRRVRNSQLDCTSSQADSAVVCVPNFCFVPLYLIRADVCSEHHLNLTSVSVIIGFGVFSFR